MRTGVSVREASAVDRELLARLLVEAVNWTGEQRMSSEQVQADPRLAHYVSGWPAPGDFGAVAVDGSGQPLGAAWARVFSAEDPGYGFVAADVPEVSIAVLPGHRGQGIGRALLRAAVDQARGLGWARLSLSVEDGNRAAALYESAGFVPVGREGGSRTMLLDLSDRQALEDP